MRVIHANTWLVMYVGAWCVIHTFYIAKWKETHKHCVHWNQWKLLWIFTYFQQNKCLHRFNCQLFSSVCQQFWENLTFPISTLEGIYETHMNYTGGLKLTNQNSNQTMLINKSSTTPRSLKVYFVHVTVFVKLSN